MVERAPKPAVIEALNATPPSLKVLPPRRAMSSISILGSGVVGRATGIGLSSVGHDVTFVDVSEDRLSVLRNEGHATQHVDNMTLDGTDAVFVAVPTPASEDGADTSYLESTCKTLGRLLQLTERGSEPKLLVFRSTMPPGTTRNTLIPAIEAGSGLRAGVDFLICYNPEYLRAYNAVEDFLDFRFLTMGTSEPGDLASHRMKDIFSAFEGATITELSYEEAEYQKYVHNVFNAVKISYFNEMRAAATKLGLSNVEPIFALTARTAEAGWNPAYGTRDAGPFGGACLPKDTAAWAAFARSHRIDAALVETTRQVNIALGGSPC
jgi:nucleotide sugar dehydrogenase